MTDLDYMMMCRELADKAKQNGHAPVGAVIVRRHCVIAQAQEGPGLEHAEWRAVRDVWEREGTSGFVDTILYSTHEPCIMCSFAIREAGIGKVVFIKSVGDIGGVKGPGAILANGEISGWSAPPELVQISKVDI